MLSLPPVFSRFGRSDSGLSSLFKKDTNKGLPKALIVTRPSHSLTIFTRVFYHPGRTNQVEAEEERRAYRHAQICVVAWRCRTSIATLVLR